VSLQQTSSLALRALLKAAASKAGLTRPSPLMTGLSPAAVALHLAALAHDAPLVVIAPTDAHVDQLVTDARFFFANIEGLTAADAERAVQREKFHQGVFARRQRHRLAILRDALGSGVDQDIADLASYYGAIEISAQPPK
jgi:hypothetical protein